MSNARLERLSGSEQWNFGTETKCQAVNTIPWIILSQRLAKEVGGLATVMPAKAGIQKHLIILDSGSRYPGM
jgi:hypothetical protein